MSSKGNPNKVVISDPDEPTGIRTYVGKQVEIKGGRLGGIVVTDGTVKLSDEVEIGQVVVVNPIGGDGEPDNAVYLHGVSGWIGLVVSLGTKRDHGKIGNATHDLTIGSWYGRCAPPMSTPEGQAPVHRDGLQIQHAARVTLGYFDFANLYPGATNGGIFITPNKSDPDVDQADTSLCVDIVLEGGRILNPNKGITLGACTRCGARGSLLVAQRPFEMNANTIDPIDEGNQKVVIDLSGASSNANALPDALATGAYV